MDLKNQRQGIYNGRVLVQQEAKVGGHRQVFVKLQGGAKNELVFPPLGCRLLNPFKGYAKFFAGDLVEYKADGTGYILKTYEVAEATDSTTVKIVRNGYRHIPFVGDILMVAPSELSGTGKAVTVNAVSATTATISGKSVDIWSLTTSAALGEVAKGAILVEAKASGNGKEMLVQNPNMVLPWDMDCIYDPASTAHQGDESQDTDFENARYLFDPIIEAVMYKSKMSPLPACVEAINGSRVDGWFVMNALANISNEGAALANFYTKSEADLKFSDKDDVYAKDAADLKFAEKATTLAGYGITDASINTETRTVTLGENSIVVPTE